MKNGSGGNIATYTYDGDGKRLTKTVYGTPTVTTTYHYFQGQLWYETLNTDLPNVIHALYLRSSNGALQAVSLNYNVGSTSNTWYYYHYNAHGDVIAVTDGNGNVYRQYVYDPYGNVISVKDGSGATVNINNDSGFNNSYTYAGYRYDSETGLYFLNARYYAAGIGRFLTKDSVLGTQKNPQTLNRYAYCGGDPVNHVDPDGHFIQFIMGLIAAAVAFFESPAGVAVEEEGVALAEEAGAEIGAVASEVVQEVSATVEKASSRVLGNNMVKDGIVRPVASAAHHIVAGAAKAAEPARQVLQRVGIGINDKVNGVFVPIVDHVRMHTNAYYDQINNLLGNVSTREEAEAILNAIRDRFSK